MPILNSDTNDLTDGSSTGDFGLITQTFPLWSCGATGTILTTGGSVFGTAVYLREKTPVSNLYANVTNAGATLTANTCWGLLYDANGTLRGQSVDQSTNWATAGLSNMALTPSNTGSLTLPAGQYWVALVASGTTLPSFSRAAMASASVALGAALYNLGVGAAQSRTGVLAASVTTSPGGIVPSAITQATGIPFWCGLN